MRAITSFGREVTAVSWLGAGDTVASASGDAGVRMNEEKLPGAQGFCFTLASDPGGKFVAAGGEDGVLRIWQTAAKKLLMELK
jgi:WD40 repeat protein